MRLTVSRFVVTRIDETNKHRRAPLRESSGICSISIDLSANRSSNWTDNNSMFSRASHTQYSVSINSILCCDCIYQSQLFTYVQLNCYNGWYLSGHDSLTWGETIKLLCFGTEILFHGKGKPFRRFNLCMGLGSLITDLLNNSIRHTHRR